MKSYFPTLIAGFAILSFFSCQQQAPAANRDQSLAKNIFLEWEVVSNQLDSVPRCRTLLQIRNASSQTITDHGWGIFYNQDAGDVIPESVLTGVTIQNLLR
jgi:hypothetical protein